MSRLRPGRTVSLSPYRRVMADWLSFSRSIPLVSIERRIHIPEVAAARATARPKPSWLPCLLKAFSIANREVPDFRRAYMTFPYSRLYEHGSSTAAILVERDVKGESVAYTYRLSRLEDRSLVEIDERIRKAKTDPIDKISGFRGADRFVKLPYLIRKIAIWIAMRLSGSVKERFMGTFACSSIHGAGAVPIHPICLQTSILTFGTVELDGSLLLRLTFDHRVMDGVTASRGLVETEKALNGPILRELLALSSVKLNKAA
ncbi:MAG: 2-oxo acid dehydrogenase subunit E2 [Gemmataceae bacterium]